MCVSILEIPLVIPRRTRQQFPLDVIRVDICLIFRVEDPPRDRKENPKKEKKKTTNSQAVETK